MTLLEVISRAAAEADGGGNLPPPSKFPIVISSDDILSKLKPEAETPSGVSLVRRVFGWKISETDSAIAELSSHLAENLRSELGRAKSFRKGEFFGLFNSFLSQCAEKLGLSIGSDAADASRSRFARDGIEKLGFLIGHELAGLIAECCSVLELWKVLEVLLHQGLIGHAYTANLTENLLEKNRTELLCLLVKHVPDLHLSELLSVLKYFLSPTDESYDGMRLVREQWKNEALLAIEKATQAVHGKKVTKLAREASILLMMAHDDFSSSEICLHYVFGSSNGEGIILSSAISKLDGQEVLGLIRYLLKWLQKYYRFPEASPCPSAGAMLGLRTCESVPSFETIVKAFGLALDEHFTYLVLNSDFHNELRASEDIISSLASEAIELGHLDSMIDHLLSEIRDK